MLTTLAVERYRCFASRVALDLAPLTVLFGKNSAGKSALLRAVPLAAASCVGGANRTGPLALEHPAAFGARYRDIRTHLAARNDVGISFEWSDGIVRFAEVGLRDMTTLGPSRQIVSRFKLRDDSGTELDAQFDPDANAVLLPGTKVALEFSGITPRSRSTGHAAKLLSACSEQMSRLSTTVDWLSPIRAVPPRARVQPIQTATLGLAGEHITEVLAQASAQQLLERVKQTVRRVTRLDLELDTEADGVALAFRSGPRLTHVLDVGSGIPQTLPVLVRLAEVHTARANGRIVAIEQPEAHLHADAEAQLAEVVVEAVSSQQRAKLRPTVLLETHSENLLLSLQLAVLDGRLRSEDLTIYWMSQSAEGGVTPLKHKIGANGEVCPQWPPGVFSENMALARRIVQTRSSRSRAGSQ